MTFRYDINALRAIAVVSVVIFHFFSAYLPGGYVGVDIFFVISGYLMTRIITSKLDEGNFSFASFYAARAKRIIPALAVMCLTVLIVCLFYLTPWDLRKLGKHILVSIGFVSNFTYLKESGYFDVAAQSKWLLHTWSLSVEWQFYLVYPVLLVSIKKALPKVSLNLALWCLTITSFLLCLYYVHTNPDQAYYLFHTRAWELLIGGVIATQKVPQAFSRNVQLSLSIVGLIAIVSALFLFDHTTPWPGFGALLPVLGTALVLYGNTNNPNLQSMFDNKVIASLGLWSYSIYLWHWPINVFVKSFTSSTLLLNTLGVLLSVALGWLSYSTIEQYKPIVKHSRVKGFFTFPPVVIVLITTIIGQLIYDSDGLLWRLSKNELIIAEAIQDRNPRSKQCHVEFGEVPGCKYGDGEVGAIVLGDSHAQSVVRSVEKSTPENESTLDWTMSSCPTISGVKRVLSDGTISEDCGNFVRSSIEKISEQYQDVPVFIVNRTPLYLWGANDADWKGEREKANLIIDEKRSSVVDDNYRTNFLAQFGSTICQISQYAPVVILKTTPELINDVPKTMFKRAIQGKDDLRVKIPVSDYLSRSEQVDAFYADIESRCDVTIIDPTDTFCDQEYCYGDDEGRPLYFDDDHLSEYGASKLIPLFKKVWGQ
ncbi:acyltransferase family protein [Vibrio sp. TRT 17S01]|uniref:acyltransferase family protein n=1 Tax=Vibrio sp. TRT 17S01 TaxID=3418505 RepID=UPI003CE8714B